MLHLLLLAAEPVLEREWQKMPDIDDFSCVPSHNGGAEHPGIFARNLDVKCVVDNIDDFIDDERHGPAAVRKYKEWLRTLPFDPHVLAHADERH